MNSVKGIPSNGLLLFLMRLFTHKNHSLFRPFERQLKPSATFRCEREAITLTANSRNKAKGRCHVSSRYSPSLKYIFFAQLKKNIFKTCINWLIIACTKTCDCNYVYCVHAKIQWRL